MNFIFAFLSRTLSNSKTFVKLTPLIRENLRVVITKNHYLHVNMFQI